MRSGVAVKQIQQASVAERIQIIELILVSLKQDMSAKSASDKPAPKPFKVPQFNLGQEVQVSREVIYGEREYCYFKI